MKVTAILDRAALMATLPDFERLVTRAAIVTRSSATDDAAVLSALNVFIRGGNTDPDTIAQLAEDGVLLLEG